MSKLRIYIAISTFLPVIGGAEKQALLQGRCLRQRGHEATIITLRHDRSWSPHEIVEGVPVERVAGAILSGRARLPGPLRKLAYVGGMLAIGWRLWRDRRRYDILHVYQLNLLALPAALVCYLGRKPLVIGVRVAPWDEADHLQGLASLVAGPLDRTTPWLKVDGATHVGGDLEQLERLGSVAVGLTRTLLCRIGAVLVVLSSRMERYLAQHDFSLPNTRLIPNGVDVARFYPASVDALDPKSVVCVSQLRYEKGVDVLLQAWRLVRRCAPQARLHIVGDGPLHPYLVRLAAALGIADSVQFVGEQSDIPAQLRRASLAVLASRTEGMPNALLEAMSCGLPCVATRVSGSEDAIEHGVNGLLVEPEDYQGMANALLMLLRSPVLAREYGLAARVTVERRYALDHVVAQYEILYETELHARVAHTPRAVP
ncbi:MAG TPA: glycosyltransferase family 4 protein [Ktedonobacterales bacterium]|nr:glycosyltransferase family 4 protein [Ktedonobacterales bacterium]